MAGKRILFLSGILLTAAGITLLTFYLWNEKKSDYVYDQLYEQFVQSVPMEIETECKEEEIKIEKEEVDWQTVQIDFAGLLDINSDIIGWISFDNIEQIHYPILYSGNDTDYLRTDIYGNSTIAGSIFMEGKNTPDFDDCHTILYGHNMKNLTMFGSLRNYREEEFYKQNQYFTIYTQSDVFRYQIFSCRDAAEDDAVYAVGFSHDENFQKLIDFMTQKSYYDTRVRVGKEDCIVTLSTCSSAGKRLVVHAVRIGEYEVNFEGENDNEKTGRIEPYADGNVQ